MFPLWSILCSDFSSPFLVSQRKRGFFFCYHCSVSPASTSDIDSEQISFHSIWGTRGAWFILIQLFFLFPILTLPIAMGKSYSCFFVWIFYNGVYWGTLININPKFSVVFTYPRDLEKRQPSDSKASAPRQMVYYDSPQTSRQTST